LLFACGPAEETGTMTRHLLRTAAAVSGALAVALCSAASASAFVPDPGDWTAAPVKAKGAKATVEFFVDPDDGSVAPTVSFEIRRCKRAGKGWSETVDLAAVPVSGGGFKIRDRHRKGRAKVDVRLAGTFDSEFAAHGTVRASVKLRGRKPVTCKLPKLTWSAELTAPIEDELVEDEETYEDDEAYDEEYEDEYDPEEDEYLPEDDEYYEDEIDS
jgi:hypothetical protein